MSKEKSNWGIWVGLLAISAAVILIVALILNGMKGQSSGDLQIEGNAKVTGLVCKDTASIHPALTDKPDVSHTNTITANFQNGNLSSISLSYEGEYETEAKANEGEAFARANYNLTLTNKYGVKDDIFSVGFSVDKTKLRMVQTTRDIGKINTNTVTYFLLDQGASIAKTREGLKKQYEAKGFSCEISD